VSITWEEALQRVRHAAALCAEGDLERLSIEEPAFALTVRRSPRRRGALPAAQPITAAEPLEQAELSVSASNGVVHGGVSVVLTSDFVGIVRFSRPVVSEGSVVNEDRELAYIESLGTRNPIRATSPGKIATVYVVDGQPVDYGHPLFAIVYDT
jgi:acetyl-CoA carboxylase biotin carboxyl carrier protein